MLSNKLLCVSIGVVLACALCYNSDCSNWHHVFQYVNQIPIIGPFVLEKATEIFHPPKGEPPTSTGTNQEKLFTAEELKAYAGEKGLHLAILGKVYDVLKGERHYAKGKTYHGFTGRDGSRAFVTGEFTDEGLTDHVLDLKPDQLLSLEKWTQTYAKDYTYKGKLIGRYYDKNGEPTAYHEELTKALDNAHNLEKQKEDLKLVYPPCDSSYVKGEGGKVFCSKTSGGIKRDWVGFPRKLFNPENGVVRCACIHQNRLLEPNLSEYPDCDKLSTFCVTSKK